MSTCCNFTATIQASTQTLNPLTTSWLARITANGGAAPAAGTTNAIDTFFNSLDSASVTSQCITCCMFVPDNLIAATTPLIAATQDPWGLSVFVLGDLSVNGLHSIGNQYLNPGVVSGISTMTTTSQSLCFYDYDANINVAGTEIAAIEAGTGSFFVSALLAGGINCDADLTGSGGRINVATPGNGFYLASRIASNDVKVYFANSGTAFASIGSSAGASSALLPSIGYLVFATNNNGSVIQGARCTMSFAWIGKGLTSGQGQALYNAVQACRVALGGGFR